jgi:hypothetical protein
VSELSHCLNDLHYKAYHFLNYKTKNQPTKQTNKHINNSISHSLIAVLIDRQSSNKLLPHIYDTLMISINFFCSCSSRCVYNNLYTNLSVNNTPCLFIYLFSIILGYMFRSHGPSSGLQHYHNTDPNYSIVTIEISTALHGKLCFSVKTQTKSRLSPWIYVLLKSFVKIGKHLFRYFYLLKFLKTNMLPTGSCIECLVVPMVILYGCRFCVVLNHFVVFPSVFHRYWSGRLNGWCE